MNEQFEEFYNNIHESQNVSSDFLKSNFVKDVQVLTNEFYLKEICKYMYEHIDLFGKGYTEALIKYINDGMLKICSVPEFLYKRKVMSDCIYLSDSLKKHTLDISRCFAKSSLASFFSDIVDYTVSCQRHGLNMNIMDFNIMLHIYIMKTRTLKNNTSVWNGVDVSKCDGYSDSTKMGFKIFRFQYNQQIVNEVKSLLKMCINCMSVFGSDTQENNTTIGMLDIVALDMQPERFVFDNINSVVEPVPSELYKHNIKILNALEARGNMDDAKVISPKLRVYLCSTSSLEYRITKSISDYLKLPFTTVHKVLQHITDWENISSICDKIVPLLSEVKFKIGRKKKKRTINRQDIFRQVRYVIKHKDTIIIDRDLYNLCRKYNVPNIEYVVYDWNSNVFKPVLSQVEIDYKKISEVAGEEVDEYLRQLYIAGQSVNLYRRLLLGNDDNFLKVIVKNVPFERATQVNKILREETQALTTEYTDNFSYMTILDSEKILEYAKYREDNGLNKIRDRYKRKFSQDKGKRSVLEYASGKKVSLSKYESVSNKGGRKWIVNFHKQNTGKYKIVNDLNRERKYYKDYDDEQDN